MNTIFLYAVIAVIVVVFAVLQSADKKNDEDVDIIPMMPKFCSRPKPAHNANTKSKLQAIKPVLDAKPLSTSNEPVTTSMNDTSKNISLLERIKDPAFRWTVLYILLALLIFCLWPRDEYVSIGHGLILNKHTGEVYNAHDRLRK